MITKAQLIPFSDSVFIWVGDNKFCIPKDLDNKEYQEYLKWVAEGNTPEPAEGTE